MRRLQAAVLFAVAPPASGLCGTVSPMARIDGSGALIFPGVEHDRTNWNGSGLPVKQDGSVKYLLHKTQGNGLEGARSTLHANGSESHFLTEIRAKARGGRRRVQLVSLHRSSKSLANKPGGVQTNREDVVIQDEIVGYSEVRNEKDYEEADWIWYGQQLKPVFELLGIPKTFLAFHDYPPENGIRLDGKEPWRLRPAAWLRYSGGLGHQHAAENHHGDPGNLSRKIYRNNTTSAVDLILEGMGAATTIPEDDIMGVSAAELEKMIAKQLQGVNARTLAELAQSDNRLVRVKGGSLDGQVYFTDGFQYRYVPNKADAEWLIKTFGLAQKYPNFDEISEVRLKAMVNSTPAPAAPPAPAR